MLVKKLTHDRLNDFLEYCRKFRNQVDDSYLYEEDLEEFEINKENPTYVLVDSRDNINGVISLMMTDYFIRGNRARFRIFHTESGDFPSYEILFKEILPYIQGLDNVFMFIDEDRNVTRNIVQQLGFIIERWSFILKRGEQEITSPEFPDGFHLKALEFGKDEGDWCNIRNTCFANLAGNNTDITTDMVKRAKDQEEFIEGGMVLLYHNNQAVGLVNATKEIIDEEPLVGIGPIAVLPEYQRKGLGRNLLRAGLKCGKNNGLTRAYLCVNAENEKAIGLYLQEGFEKEDTIICYRYNIVNKNITRG